MVIMKLLWMELILHSTNKILRMGDSTFLRFLKALVDDLFSFISYLAWPFAKCLYL